MEEKRVTLASINQGAASELFDLELSKVIANIRDPNTKPDGVREIVLKIAFKPNRDRDMTQIIVSTAAKLVSPRGHESVGFLSRGQNGIEIVQQDPNQGNLDLPGKVIELKK